MFFLGDPITQTSVCVRDSAIFISMMLGPAFDDVAYADQFCTGQLFYRLGVARAILPQPMMANFLILVRFIDG